MINVFELNKINYAFAAFCEGFFNAENEVSIIPKKPKRPCSYPGCKELTEGRYCEEHQTKSEQHYNKYQRDPETRKRYGRSWKRIRDRYIKLHLLCEECEKQGILTPAQEVHHIKPLSKGGDHDIYNLMALCNSCHSKITAKDGGRWG